MLGPAAVSPKRTKRSPVSTILKKPILKLVNESELPLEDLSLFICDHFKEFYCPKEDVQLIGTFQDGNRINGTVIKRIVKKLEKSCEYSYNVKLFDRSEIVTGVPARELRRLSSALTTEIIQAFIQANAKCGKDSSGHLRWVINSKPLKPRKKHPALKPALSDQNKNVKPDCALTEKRKSENSKMPPKSKAVLKSVPLQPAVKKMKLGKPANSPKTGVPPIWAKLLKSFPLEPEVVLVRLEDGKAGTIGDKTSPCKPKLKEKFSSVVCGKENIGKSSSPNKKMKQITLFDMNKKPTPVSANKFAIHNTPVREKKVVGATSDLVINTSSKTKADKLKNVTKMNKTSLKNLENVIKTVSQNIASVESNVGSSPSIGTSTVKKITFKNFTTTAKSSPGAVVGIFTKQLPPPTPVKTPSGFENKWFGDAAMIMQFISSFRNVLQPDKSIIVSTTLLMEAVMKGSEGFLYLNSILACLLKTLLQDCSAEDFMEAEISLSDVPITIYSAAELTRLYLKKNAHKDMSEEAEKWISQPNKELHHLEPNEKLKIICQLCSNVLTCYTIQNYVTKIEETLAQLRGKRRKDSKENKTKTMPLDNAASNETKNETSASAKQKLSAESFYGPLALNDSSETALNKDELKSRLSTRRLSLQKAKEEKLKAKQLEEERIMKEKEEQEKEDFKTNLQFHEDEVKSVRGLRPLGKDRNMSCYWTFSHFTSRLVVEKRWWEAVDAKNKTNGDCEPSLSPKKADHDSISQNHENLWFAYETTEDVKAFLQCLSMEDNENSLRKVLKNYLSNITATVTDKNKSKEENLEPDGDFDLMETFRDEILDVHSKIMKGVLAEMSKPEKWIADVDNARTCHEFSKCLLSLQNSVYPKFLIGDTIHQPHKKTNKFERPKIAIMWQDMVKTCQTMSRMHVLLGLFVASIKWENSSANTKCKVCKKLGKDTLLLCDGCSKGFHLGCLRPQLLRVPKDDWFCPSCQKTKEQEEELENAFASDDAEEKRRIDEDEESSEEEKDMLEFMKENVRCEKCKGKSNERLFCVKCNKGWHPFCHNPRIRRIPRGPWLCRPCEKGKERHSQRSNRSTR